MDLNKISFDSLLLVFVAVLFIVSAVSAVQLNELQGKIVSFKETSSSVVSLSSDSSSNISSSSSDEEILAKLNQAPDMVGGC